MLGQLPTSLSVNGIPRSIRADYRNILRIFSAFNSEELSDNEKATVFLKRMYVDFMDIPAEDYADAYKKATEFIECRIKPDKPEPRLVDWDKDEQLIFAAVNKVAGREVRMPEFLHWWTFLGYFQGIDREDTWSFILLIRQKQVKHKKLEPHEREFFLANRSMCELTSRITDRKKEADDFAEQLLHQLLQEQQEQKENGGDE